MIKDISTRLYTAIFFTFFVIGSLVLSQWSYTLLFFLISLLCGYEFYKIVFDKIRASPAQLFYASSIWDCNKNGVPPGSS